MTERRPGPDTRVLLKKRALIKEQLRREVEAKERPRRFKWLAPITEEERQEMLQ